MGSKTKTRTPSSERQFDELRATLRSMLAEEKDDQVITMVIEMLLCMSRENTALQMRLQKQLKARFGQSSEKVSGAQLSLFLKIMGADDAEDDETETPDAEAWREDKELAKHFDEKKEREKEKRRHGRNPLPKHLPRKEIILPVAKSHRICSECGSKKQCIGHDKSEVLEWVPGSFQVLVYAREKLACRRCQGKVSIAPVADKVIEGGLPGPGLLAEVILKKYKYALPLWRQAEFFATMDVHLAESTMCGWVQSFAQSAAPIRDEIKRRTLLSRCINTDDSHIRVLDRNHPKGIKRGVMWVYIGDGLEAFFDYTVDRSRDGPMRILHSYKGKLQADAYSVYDIFFVGDDATAIEVGCAMHARRYFVEALEAGFAVASCAIAWFRYLYKIEEYAKDIGADEEERLRIRQQKSAPVMKKLHAWMTTQAKVAAPKTPLSDALGYSLRQWDALSQFLHDGSLEIDNGLAERTIRTLAIGRKNYMFAGSDAGAEAAAVIYSLIASCKLAGVDTGKYLRDVMIKLASGWPQAKIGELVPSSWAQIHGLAEPPPSKAARLRPV